MEVSKELLDKIKKIKFFVMDVDGTLTNGKVFYSKNGEELKIFSIRDGMGIELLRRGGIEIGIITSEHSPIVEARANKLKIKNLILGSRNKKKDLNDLLNQLPFDSSETAFIGDDVNDIEVMKFVGLSACPSDSNKNVKEIADYICSKPGGEGAVREFAELILINQNKSIILPENW
ncbi:MAG: HAD-IIIA family hydrolase [Candidatus Kapabacteria bacterium]|nr:HAD-IIIA family hydrolase [Candidatus Kapabacteria bacterium]